MKTRLLLLLLALVCAVVLAALSGLAVTGAYADDPPPTPGAYSPFDPAEVIRGRPYPGASYPYHPVARPAPAGWALTPRPKGVDLDVTYINRTPMYHAYCVQHKYRGIPRLCPGTEEEKRWPLPGEVVTFTAHIINKGTAASPPFAYRWFIDGAQVASGVHPGLAPGAEGTATYLWAWAHVMDGERVVDDHTIRFVVDPGNAIRRPMRATTAWRTAPTPGGSALPLPPRCMKPLKCPGILPFLILPRTGCSGSLRP